MNSLLIFVTSSFGFLHSEICSGANFQGILSTKMKCFWTYQIENFIYCKFLIWESILINLSAIYEPLPASNYMFKVNNRNTRTRSEICSNLTIKTPKRRQWHCSGVFIVNFEHISHLVLLFLLLTLSR